MSEVQGPSPLNGWEATISSLIPRLARAHRAQIYQPLADLGLAPSQELLLMRLWTDGPQRQADLAAVLGVSAPTIAKMVSRLEAAGMVLRTRSTTDSRAIDVSLSEKGAALRPAVESAWADLEARTIRTLEVGEQGVLAELLSRIVDDLERDGLE